MTRSPDEFQKHGGISPWLLGETHHSASSHLWSSPAQPQTCLCFREEAVPRPRLLFPATCSFVCFQLTMMQVAFYLNRVELVNPFFSEVVASAEGI